MFTTQFITIMNDAPFSSSKARAKAAALASATSIRSLTASMVEAASSTTEMLTRSFSTSVSPSDWQGDIHPALTGVCGQLEHEMDTILLRQVCLYFLAFQNDFINTNCKMTFNDTDKAPQDCVAKGFLHSIIFPNKTIILCRKESYGRVIQKPRGPDQIRERPSGIQIKTYYTTCFSS